MDQFMDRLRESVPNIDELWDPNLPMPINIARVVNGDAQAELHARRHRQQQPASDSSTSVVESAPVPKSQPPAFLRQVQPNIDELWDSNLTVARNIARIDGREAGIAQEGEDSNPYSAEEEEAVNFMVQEIESFGRMSAPRRRPNPLLAPQQQTTAGATIEKSEYCSAECEDIIRALRRPAPENLQSPLLALQQQVLNIFKHGPQRATGVYGSLSGAAQSGLTKAKMPDGDLPIPWNSCKAAATLIGLLACPSDRVYEVVKFLSQALGGLPTLKEIRKTPSASLQTAYQNAKALACGEKHISSAIVVSLTDVHIFELAAKGRSEEFTSFAHSFVIGIGPEGVIVWQGWGEHDYGLDQWIKDGRAQVQTWQEAGDLVGVFEKFAAYKASSTSNSRCGYTTILILFSGQMGCQAEHTLQEALRCRYLQDLRRQGTIETDRSEGRVLGQAVGYGGRQAG
jgi:hypothetical protein